MTNPMPEDVYTSAVCQLLHAVDMMRKYWAESSGAHKTELWTAVHTGSDAVWEETQRHAEINGCPGTRLLPGGTWWFCILDRGHQGRCDVQPSNKEGRFREGEAREAVALLSAPTETG